MDYQAWSTASIPVDHFPSLGSSVCVTNERSKFEKSGKEQQITSLPQFNLSVREQMLLQLGVKEEDLSELQAANTCEVTNDTTWIYDYSTQRSSDIANNYTFKAAQFVKGDNLTKSDDNQSAIQHLPLKMQMLLQLREQESKAQRKENSIFTRKALSRESLHLNLKEMSQPSGPLRYPRRETLEKLEARRIEWLNCKTRKEGKVPSEVSTRNLKEAASLPESRSVQWKMSPQSMSSSFSPPMNTKLSSPSSPHDLDVGRKSSSPLAANQGRNSSPSDSTLQRNSGATLRRNDTSPSYSGNRLNYEVPPRFRKQANSRTSPKPNKLAASESAVPKPVHDFASWRQTELESSLAAPEDLEEEVDIDALLLGPPADRNYQGRSSPSELMLGSMATCFQTAAPSSVPSKTSSPAATSSGSSKTSSPVIKPAAPSSGSSAASSPATKPAAPSSRSSAASSLSTPVTPPMLVSAPSPRLRSPASLLPTPPGPFAAVVTPPLTPAIDIRTLPAAKLMEKQHLQELQREQVLIMLVQQHNKVFKNEQLLRLLTIVSQRQPNLAMPYIVPELLKVLMGTICVQTNLTPLESFAAKRLGELAQAERRLFHQQP